MIDQLKRAVEEVVRNVFPNLPFFGMYRYRVVVKNPGDERWILQCCSKQTGLPDAFPISIWQGVPGVKADLAQGSEVLLSFIEGDPTKPIVTHFCGPDMSGFVPVSLVLSAKTSVVLGDEPGMPVARMTDTVQMGPFVGVISSGSTKVRSS